MEEDEEIEQLLKSNEEMLLEAANASDNDDPFEDSSFVADNKYGKNKVDLESGNDSCYGENTIEASKNNESQQSDDEIQEMLDHHMVSLISSNPKKHYVTLHSQDSDEESTSSEDSDYSSIRNNRFIDEIMDDEESSHGGRDLTKTMKQVEIKSKEQSINELSIIQRLVLKRKDLLTKLEKKLQQDLCENEEKQRKIQASMMALSVTDSRKAREPSFTRCFFKKFGMPYFEDPFGFTPPHNEDHMKKLARGELIISKIPKVQHWIKHHRNMLMEAIRGTIIEEHSTNLIDRINNFKEALDSSKDVDKNVELEQNIVKLQDELRLIKRKTYSELVTEEVDDRDYDWMKYSVSVFNNLHSAEECRRYWHVYLKPSVNKAKWESSEDSKLLEIASKMQYQNWDAIAETLGTNRTAYQCFVHFQTRLHATHNHTTGKWTIEEDKKLLNIINSAKIGEFIPWTKVSSHMPMRTHCQIYNRWINCLNPKLVKGKFTKEEDLLIVSGIEVFGVSYKEMATLMENRSSSQIRERYERHLLPKTAKVGTWALEEDEKLLSLIKKHGENNWVAISKEMKTRSRTQVRQRYGFIKTRMAKQPGWDITQIKRKHCNNISKELLKTQKYVDKLKKEIDHVEEVFKLSKLESDTFRIEKLKDLKDSILLRKFDLRRNGKRISEHSDINTLLLDHFKNTKLKAAGRPFLVRSTSDYNAYFNEIFLMAKYFGHDLKIPDNKEEILSNSRLGANLKNILCNTINSRTGLAKPSTEESYFNSPAINIDYVEPEFDDSILMNEWWHTPPVDVNKLNFSEFLKRTVFDYSYGMHKDIWVSKINRSTFPDFTTQNNSTALEEPILHQQPYYIPCNYLTTLGLRSLVLSKTRLKRDIRNKNLPNCNEQSSNNEEFAIKSDDEVNQYLLDQFQETMNTLFTWPKVLSQTSINSTPVIRKKSKKRRKNKTNYDLFAIMTTSTEKSSSITQQKREKIRETILNQNEVHQREMLEFKSGTKCHRKMKIDHELNNVIEDISYKLPRKRKISKIKKTGDKKSKKKRVRKQNKLFGIKDELLFESDSDDLLMPCCSITYSKSNIASKRNIESGNNSCGTVVKKKKSGELEVVPVESFNDRVESCEPETKKTQNCNGKEKSDGKLDGVESCLKVPSDGADTDTD